MPSPHARVGLAQTDCLFQDTPHACYDVACHALSRLLKFMLCNGPQTDVCGHRMLLAIITSRLRTTT